ncbi:MAG: ABC transporter ATP-binding protein [Brevinematales bacterium]|nr:ABC transporter ATP-binding protein [Brevinematales bacterium]
MKPKRKFTSYIFRYKASLIFSILFAMTYSAGQVGGLLSVGGFFQNTLIGNNFEYINFTTIAFLIGFGFLWAASHYLAYLSSNTLAIKVIHDLRGEIYERLIDLPIPYYKKNRSGEILSRILNDIGVIEVFLMNIVVEMIAQPITVVAIVIILLTTNLQISLYFFSIVPVIGLAIAGLGALVQNRSMKVQKNISDITSHIQETVFGIEVIKGFGVESEIRRRFAKTNDAHLNSLKKEVRIRLLGTPTLEFLGVIGILIILILGAMGIQSGMAKSGDIITFIMLALGLSLPLSQVGNIAMVLRKLKPASDRIFEIINSEEKEDFAKPDMGIIEGAIELKNLSFGYDPERIILDNIDLKIRPGETVAVVGSSGAGKSTLISLIPVFNSPTSGQILIDGKDTSGVNPLTIRRQLSIVTQETILFSGTISENILLSRPDATHEDVIEAAKIANAHDFIMEIPTGYDTIIGERGMTLSGGQRQRIVLARAIIRKPKILILDEATSSLDAESEKLIAEAMKRILGKQTTLIITHKLSSVANADTIIVIEGGKIIERGTHKELLEKKGIYDKLYKIQLNV